MDPVQKLRHVTHDALSLANHHNGWDLLNAIQGNRNRRPQTISHAVTIENHFFRVKCDHVHGKFAYAINMYCEMVLNSS